VTVPATLERETVWLSQGQMSALFGKERSVITKHIRNAVLEGEVDEKSNVHFLHIPRSDKPVAFYNLDVIISVGYRVKSQRGVEFRRWATSVLRDYMLKGYALNQQRLKTLGQVVSILKRADKQLDAKQVLSVVERYTSALELLDAYDHQRIAAAIFLYFLNKNRMLLTASGAKRIADHTLVALTLMIAESKPVERELMVNLVMTFLTEDTGT